MSSYLTTITSYIPFVSSPNQQSVSIEHHHQPISMDKPPPASSPVAEIDYEALPDDSSFVAQLTAGAFAGVMEHSLIYPVDVIKTRMQLFLSSPATAAPATGASSALANASVSPAKSAARHILPNSIIGSIVNVTSAEGSLALWKGVSSVLLGAGPAHAVYFGVFEWTKTALVDHFKSSGSSTNRKPRFITDESHPLIASMAGVAGTTASDALMTPFDVLKQRMQAIKSISPGAPARPNLFSLGRRIYQIEGLRAFWISYPATLLLNIPFAAINFGIYEYVSLVLNPTHTYSPLVHCLAGGVSGAAAAAVTNPLDFIKTFLQTKALSEDPKIKELSSFKDALLFAIKKENGGYKNFLKGIRPRIFFNIPSTAISWTSYEMAKSYLC